MNHQVVITGVGVISPLGDSLPHLHEALCAGRCAIYAIELFSTHGCGCPAGAEVKSFDAQKYLGKVNLRPLDRTGRFAASAASLALGDSGWTAEAIEKTGVGLVLGTMFGSVRTISEFDRRALEAGPVYASPMDFSNTVINAATGQTAIVHKLHGLNSTISAGQTSGLQAIAYASDMIRQGRAEALLAGGAEEICFESFYNFDRAGLLCRGPHEHRPVPFDAQRNGFVLGEGAALLMLENEASALARGARTLGRVSGAASGYDSTGGGNAVKVIARTIEAALTDARVNAGEIDCVSCSANGDIEGDQSEANALATVFGKRAQQPAVTAIKSMLGETLGAAGALQTAAMIGTIHDGALPGIHGFESADSDCPVPRLTAGNLSVDARAALINSIGFDGHCCSLVLSKV